MTAEVTIADRSKLFASRLGDQEEGGEEAKPQESKFGVTVRGITPKSPTATTAPAQRASWCRT